MATPERISDVAKLMMKSNADKGGRTMVVVSALGSHPTSPVKVTDLLLNMVSRAAKQDLAFTEDLDKIKGKHRDAAKKLLGDNTPALEDFLARLERDSDKLQSLMQAVAIAGVSNDVFTDFVAGHGELWSAYMLSLYLKQQGADAEFMDARDVLVVSPAGDGSYVDLEYDMSNSNLDKWAQENGAPKIVVCTGFVAKTPQGQATTLKRNGSDYSATIMGALLRSSYITIWTDVDGVYSADPRKVPEAVCLKALSYNEAWEMSYFGANVLHPRTTLPAMRYKIPVAIRNFFNLSSPGTQIVALENAVPQTDEDVVKGFATIDNVSLINVEGTGMVGVPGTAAAIFQAVRDANVNVIMISQASSEHSVCFAVKSDQSAKALSVLKERFKDAIAAGRISAVEAISDCSILAAVGQQMASRRGVAATMFSALAKSNVNIRATAQGCSEYNITVVIDGKDSTKALRAVHSRFYLSDCSIAIGLIGPGLIGKELLNQIRDQAEVLRRESNIDLRVMAIATSKRMVLSNTAIDLAEWEKVFEEKGEPADMARLGAHLRDSFVPNSCVIDCTASDAVAGHYIDWMKSGVHVITPNKKMGSGPMEQYRTMQKLTRESFIHFFYEATVGAGLPVIATLQHLIETGDKVQRVEGILSGTLSYIFNTYKSGMKFSDVVKDARAKGYTEPDPRDDLAGMDVARKVVILARECGLEVELSDMKVQSLVPEPLRKVSVDEFMSRVHEYDDQMSQMAEEALAKGEVLRFVGVVDAANKTCSVELKSYPQSHPFAQLSGTDNILTFKTKRYHTNQLIVRGPGAGAEVTAGGIFSDILRLAAFVTTGN
jgi:bifunctional aspartokinase / homoserine dehydrogenase 1